MPKTRAQLNRAVRQEALREQLENQGHLQHVVDILEKFDDPNSKLENDYINRLKFVVETKLKLINKYLPDLKATEHSGQIDSEVTRRHRVTFK